MIEKSIWAKRRPPLHLRDQIREGQRIEGHEIELFLVRSGFSDPTRQIEVRFLNKKIKPEYVQKPFLCIGSAVVAVIYPAVFFLALNF